MHRHLAVAPLALLFAATACSDASPTAITPESTASDLGASSLSMAAPHAPAAPEPITRSVTFRDTDPCTGKEHTLTIASTIWTSELPDGREVIRWERRLSSDSGYEGRGVRTIVDNGNVFKLRNMDVWSHPDGRQFQARGLIVLDLRTDPPTVRVQEGGLICLRS